MPSCAEGGFVRPPGPSWVRLDDLLERRRAAAPLLGLAAAAVLALGLLNYGMVIGPRRHLGSNEPYRLALEIRAQTRPGDLIFADPDDLDSLFLVYFGERRPHLVPVYRPGWQAAQAERIAAADRAFVLRDGRLLRLGKDGPFPVEGSAEP